VQFRVFGGVEVLGAAGPVALGPPQRRAVLAALLADAGRAVPSDTIAGRVWDDPPAGARRALHAHVARLRRALEPVPLVTRAGGYALEVSPDDVDLLRFRKLAGAVADGTPERRTLLKEALELWRGSPLAGVPGSWAGRVREGLVRQRVGVVGALAQELLESGEPAPALVLLQEATVEYPLAEPLFALLIRALVATGRRAEALECYASLRARTRERLGAEPGASLRSLHQAVLRNDALPAPARAKVDAPAQLPPKVPGVVGRDEELRWLGQAAQAEASSPAIVVLSGSPGVGKTTLALEWAYRMRSRFPDGQLYVNLRGFDPAGPPLEPDEALRCFLDALGVPDQRIPADRQARVGLYRSLLAERSVLILLDNASGAGQVRALLPGSPESVVLVTSRNRMDGLVAMEGARALPVDVLTSDAAVQLLAGRLGPSRVAAEAGAASEIVARCARLPLALAVAAAQAGPSLAALAAELGSARGRLDTLDTGDPAGDVRAVFALSYRTLGRAAALMFRLLGVCPGPDVSTAAAGALAGLSVSEAMKALAELDRAHLVSQPGPDRHTVHDLLRAYAGELATGEERLAAQHRLLDYYVRTAYAASCVLDKSRDRLSLGTGDFTDARAAEHWLAAEHPVLDATVRWALHHRFDRHAAHLAWALVTYLTWRGRWREWAAPDELAMTVWRHLGTEDASAADFDAARAALGLALEVQELALTAWQRLGDEPQQARAHRALGRAYTRTGDVSRAQAHLQQALRLFGAIGRDLPQGDTHLDLSRALSLHGDARRALVHAERALTRYRRAGFPCREADALSTAGRSAIQLGAHRDGIARCRRAVAIHQHHGDARGAAAGWETIGGGHRELGEHSEAIAAYQRALSLSAGDAPAVERAQTLTLLGEAHAANSDQDEACRVWRTALRLLTEIGHPAAAQLGQRLGEQ
jgi:DNA-binding SARP family transcriptional activator/cytochrome c-type biogenesis protein CcmH/NrfG